MQTSVIACDFGTGGTKSALYLPDGRCVAQHFAPCQSHHPLPGYHEQRPEEWWDSVVTSITALVLAAGSEAASIGAIALSGHSLGCVPVDGDGTLLQEFVPIWSDGRAVDEAALYFQEVDQQAWYLTTGNGFPASLYTLFKMMWLRQHRPQIFHEAKYIFGTKDFINYRLTGLIATDPSYASGLGAFDLRAGDYHDGFLAAAGFDRSLLPPIRPSASVLGPVLPDVAHRLGIPLTVQVVTGGVDNSCMALGARSYREGDLYSSMGSSSWIAVASANPLLNESAGVFVFAHVVPDVFVSATSIFSSGRSLDWVCSILVPGARPEDAYASFMEGAARAPAGAGGLLFIPTLGGGTSLEGGPAVRGAFVGLDLGHDRTAIMRATLEGIAFALRLPLDALRQMTDVKREMIMVGGGAKSPFWRSIFADAFDCSIIKTPIDRQAAALGAAALGFVGIGIWSDYSQIDKQHIAEDRSDPNPVHRGAMDAGLKAFRLAARQQAELAPALSIYRGTAQ